LSFGEPVVFNSEEVPPASHNTGGTLLAPETMGKIQIKGKQPGTAVLTFTLKHKISGATKSIVKTVVTIEDPIQYIIEPAPTIDIKNKERAAIPFDGQYHTYQNPRFKIRLHKYSFYSKNTEGNASVVFSAITSLTNVAKLTITGGSYYKKNVEYGIQIELAYDTDYFVIVTAPSTHPWNVPIGSEQFLDIKMIKATNQQTQIKAEYNDKVKYTLRAYKMPNFIVIGEAGSESYCGNQNTETSNYSIHVPEARVVIYPGPYPSVVTKTTCSGTFVVGNLKVAATWNDGNELYSNPYITGLVTGTYQHEKVVGDRIEMFLSLLPPLDPNWNKKGPGVTVTNYNREMKKAVVKDNWGYSAEVNVEIPSKIVYGIY